jgi:hypothetical protein
LARGGSSKEQWTRHDVTYAWEALLIVRPTAIERAFFLAASGRINDFRDLRLQLTAERYDVRQIDGPHLLKELRALIHAARTGEPIPNPSTTRPSLRRRRTTVRRD